MKHALEIVVFKDFSLHSVFMANTRLAKVVSVEFAGRLRLCAVLCETTKQAVNLSVHQDGGRPEPGFRKYWRQKLASLKSECRAITNKYSEAASVVRKYTEYSVTLRTLPDAYRLKWLKSLSRTLLWVMWRAEQTCVELEDGKPLSNAPYGM
jgi:hypothetical protein